MLVDDTFLQADQTTAANGIDDASAWLNRPVPDVYSADYLNLYLLQVSSCWLSGNRMLCICHHRLQHKFAPEQKGALDFYAMTDDYLGQLASLARRSSLPPITV